HFFLAPDFRVYQLVTYMFMHGGFAHLFFNMFALWMFGCVVERALGTRRYIVFYIVCGIGAGLFQEAAQTGELLVMCSEQLPGFGLSDLPKVVADSAPVLNLWTTVGASGAIYAILLAFGMLFPEQRIFIFPLPIPIKAKWFVMIYAAIELFSAMSTTQDGVAHVAHLGGMVFGYFFIRYWRKHPYDAGFGYGKNGFFSDTRGGRTWRNRWSNSSSTIDTGHYNDVYTREKDTDWDYNARQTERQKEIDAILDKIRKSGYDSLTTEEKQKLFDAGNH
ncbi:MAG: rhomboid family intramembrane serine protease, partial [Prevotella sp.]|nr:rhomboid family intramembrane serine protease [Prevotella sp.]